jgi:hypothetical protein
MSGVHAYLTASSASQSPWNFQKLPRAAQAKSALRTPLHPQERAQDSCDYPEQGYLGDDGHFDLGVSLEGIEGPVPSGTRSSAKRLDSLTREILSVSRPQFGDRND